MHDKFKLCEGCLQFDTRLCDRCDLTTAGPSNYLSKYQVKYDASVTQNKIDKLILPSQDDFMPMHIVIKMLADKINEIIERMEY